MDNKSGSGLSVSGVMLVVFVILKFCGVMPIAAHGWLWVLLMPFAISFLIVFGIIAIIALIAGLIKLFGGQ